METTIVGDIGATIRIHYGIMIRVVLKIMGPFCLWI